jgi:hypothetical protein
MGEERNGDLNIIEKCTCSSNKCVLYYVGAEVSRSSL